ncbi:methyl-accepting chemotaxis protein [Pelosinus propionicus]|uniref:Methyl-accepting chemotaxis protein (MCP) signalling domain-containing protein n=1 Tax=Pelosinus propionicus DSM 13327 TaxID=1123291 RepID=A0A1I4HYZ7_9FIRM|nr:methyl-accepting chemotaxis protein [Pelosinus propionicus]SFL46791.1 Methyl-accepting chemotaxis protein (MCP) signalling domain-containing protein [Pelosinus propionicus DSM 13327]
MQEKISFIGTARGKFSAQEVHDAVVRVLGENAVGHVCLATELPRNLDHVDLVVCVATMKKKVAERVPHEKIVGIDLVPTTDFFSRVARIPSGETAYLFSDSINYANWLIMRCKENYIQHINMEIIQIAALSEQEVEKKLKGAKYLIGVENTVGKNGVMQRKFGSYIRKDAVIIGALRTASLESACELMQWAVSKDHRQMLENFTEKMQELYKNLSEITNISNHLKKVFRQESEQFSQINEDMGNEKERLATLKNLAQNLLEATQNIGDVTGAIKHISAQTNLLALNATIEAARVGEQGRGFAVVAREIGKLAGESKTSTEKIHSSIQEVIGFVNKIAPTLEELAQVIDYNQNVFMQASNKSREEEMSVEKIHSVLEAIKAMGGELNKDMKEMTYK